MNGSQFIESLRLDKTGDHPVIHFSMPDGFGGYALHLREIESGEDALEALRKFASACQRGESAREIGNCHDWGRP